MCDPLIVVVDRPLQKNLPLESHLTRARDSVIPQYAHFSWLWSLAASGASSLYDIAEAPRWAGGGTALGRAV